MNGLLKAYYFVFINNCIVVCETTNTGWAGHFLCW